MPYVTNDAGNILMQGKNLAVVLRYARKSPVDCVRVDYSVTQVGQYAVTFQFDDGARCLTLWADWRVLLDWLVARKSWQVNCVRFAHPGMIEKAEEHHAHAKLRARGVEFRGARQCV